MIDSRDVNPAEMETWGGVDNLKFERESFLFVKLFRRLDPIGEPELSETLCKMKNQIRHNELRESEGWV